MTKAQRRRAVFRKQRNSELAHRIEMKRQKAEANRVAKAMAMLLGPFDLRENLERFEHNNHKRLEAEHDARPRITYFTNTNTWLPAGKVEIMESIPLGGFVAFVGEGVRTSF